MSVILLLLGIVISAAGFASVGFGIPINEFTIGTTLIIAGVTALTGGLILIGLAAVVAELGRLAEALKTRTVVRASPRSAESLEAAPPAGAATVAPPAAAAGGVRAAQGNAPGAQRPRAEVPGARLPEPYPTAAPSAVDVSAVAIERLRSTIPRTERPRVEPSIVTDDGEVPLSPNGGVHHQSQPRPPGVEPAATEPKVTAEDRAGGAAVETLKSSRLDFLFRSKPARPETQPENFDAVWPADARPGRSPDAEPGPQQVDEGPRQSDHAAPAEDRESESPQLEEPRAAAILKSGVVDGMAYTLYADGSIEAKLPHGTVRFGSIAELRAHIESNS